MKWPVISGVIFEENVERLKITLPIRSNWFLFGLFTVCILVWVGMSGVILWALLTQGFEFVLVVLLLLWLIIWYWLGQILWRQWQYYAANREILFINKEQLIVRRPVSILGLTTVYDMKHISPFYGSDKHHCPAFDYGHQSVYFGHGLAADGTQQLIKYLNSRFFPQVDDE